VTSGLARRSVSVTVPATSANLGAGFDALALALELTNRVRLEVLDREGIELEVRGQGAGRLDAGRDNRFLAGLWRGLEAALGAVPDGIGWRIEMDNEIPFGRGLGSSAAATVAGLLAADALTGGRLDERTMLRLAAGIEGHPDNAAAALLGGFVVVADVDGAPLAVRFEPPHDLRAVLFIPERELSTSSMRAVLPASVPRRDAVHNVGRASLAVAAFASGRVDLLDAATEDRLHEPYRAAVYPELPSLVAAARAAGARGACLSGAGSTVIAFASESAVAEGVSRALADAAAAAGLAGSVRVVETRRDGAASA
jgi:homoserine kinase